jgi:polysaccharide lyase-like protein
VATTTLTYTTLAVLACLLSLPVTARADLVFDGRWAKPGLAHWDMTIFQKSGNRNQLDYTVSPRRRRAGYSASLLVGGNAQSERIVFLKQVFKDAEGKDDWWAWSVYIPSGSEIPNTVYAVSLFSGYNGPICGLRGPANSLYMTNPDPSRPADRWRYIVTGGKNTCSVRYADVRGLRVVKDRWIDFVCRFRWSSAPGATGLSRCYYRVQPARGWRLGFNVVGPNLVSSVEYPGALRVHYGLYKGEARPYVHIDLGGLVVADTRRQAEGAAFGPAQSGAGAASGSTGQSDRVALLILVAMIVVGAIVLSPYAGPKRWRATRRHT